jgi:diguanylate cyclase (GGDEF)-like protein/PAS domain S-box-containing protein
MKDDYKTKKQLVQELSELRSLNAALEKSESAEKYRSLVENIRDVIYELDSQGVVLYISPAIRDLLGYESTEIVGKNFTELAHKDDLSSLTEWFSELRKGREHPSEYRILNKSGEVRWTRTQTRPIMEDNLFKGARGILIDVTAQRQEAEALRTLSVRTEAILAAVPDIIMEVDGCKRYTWANKAGLQFFGEDVVGREASYYFEGEQETYNKVQPLFDGVEDVIYIESWQRRKDGEKRLLSWWCKVLKDKQGLVTGALSTARDITALKRAEKALFESEERYRALVDNASDIVFKTDEIGHFTFVNPAGIRIIGYKKEEIIGRHYPTLIRPDMREEAIKFFGLQFVKGVENTYFEYPVITKEGGEIWLGQNTKLIVKDGHVAGFQAVARNITALKQVEEKLRRNQDHAERLAQEMEIIAEIGKVVSSTLDIEEVYESFAVEVRKLILFDSLTVNLYNFQENTLFVAYVSGFDIDGRRQGDTLVMEGSLSEAVIRTRTSLRIQPARIDESVGQFPRLTPVFKAGLRSIMCVPQIYRDKVIAVLHFRSKKQDAYTEQDLRLAEKIGMQISGAIANAQLYAGLKKAEQSLKESEQRYRELSIIDDLTQLYNSRHFYFQLKIELDRSNRYGQPLTLLLLDIDNFKHFNDTYGHVEGDQVLRRLGLVVKRCLRETDFAYRYGGEEFTILLPMTTSADGAVTAERILTEFKKETFSPVPGQDVHVTVSIGLAQYKPQEEMKVFVHRVDQLMYQGKKNGKDRVCSES